MATDRNTITSSKHTAEISILSSLFCLQGVFSYKFNTTGNRMCIVDTSYLFNCKLKLFLSDFKMKWRICLKFLFGFFLRDISSKDGELCSAPTQLSLFSALEADCLYSACVTSDLFIFVPDS